MTNNELLMALRRVLYMSTKDRVKYFYLRDDQGHTDSSTLHAVIEACSPEDIINGVREYRRDKYLGEILAAKEEAPDKELHLSEDALEALEINESYIPCEYMNCGKDCDCQYGASIECWVKFLTRWHREDKDR